jgi:Asp-tRNAAsn/Glu-tRNAGln amidotransferase A subunit and related amidases
MRDVFALTRRDFGKAIGALAVAGPGYAQSESRGGDDLCDLSAIELAARLKKHDVSARDVMAAHLARIERVNPKVNAVVTLVAERAMEDAARADEALARGGTIGPLHGLPVAHKDLVDTAGIRTTRGSPFYRDNVPTRDALIVSRIRSAGAITLGKTNTPEFGAGSQTFNTVFGATRNPFDLTRTCGGVAPLRRRASRCSTPKRCCSSTTTSPRSKNPTDSLISACVPTTIWEDPETAASMAFLRSAVDIWPVMMVGLSFAARSGPRVRAMERRCCPASTSVGASQRRLPTGIGHREHAAQGHQRLA